MGIECILCQSKVCPRISDVFCTPCGHIFHRKCIFEYLFTAKACPRCKVFCNISQLFQLFGHLNDSEEDEERTNLKLQNELLMHRISQLTRQIKVKDLKFEKLFKMVGQISDTMRCFESNNRELKEENEELEEEIEKMRLASVELTVPTDSRMSWVSWYHPQQPELYDSVLNP